MIKTAIARRYTKALFELLDQSNIEAMRGALNALSQAMKDSSSLRHVIASPAFGIQAKSGILTELAERVTCPPVGKAFLGLLVKTNRIRFLPDIADAFGKLVDQSKGTEQVTVSSAAVLPQLEQDRIKTRLRETLKREVEVTFQSDASHLAGLLIRIGSLVVDNTIRRRLASLRTTLTRE